MNESQLILMWTFYAVGVTLAVIFIAAIIFGAWAGLPIFGMGIPKAPEPQPIQPKLSPADIERMIEEVGRDRVFARADALGWGGAEPPLWVWAEICRDLRREVTA